MAKPKANWSQFRSGGEAYPLQRSRGDGDDDAEAAVVAMFREKEDRRDNGDGVTLSRERQEMRGMLGAIAAWSEVADVCTNVRIWKQLRNTESFEGKRLLSHMYTYINLSEREKGTEKEGEEERLSPRVAMSGHTRPLSPPKPKPFRYRKFLNFCLIIIKKMLEYCTCTGQGRKLTAEPVSGEVDERKACTTSCERTKGPSSYNHKYHV
ncbi:hypothetical protein ALC53_09647 [Atta colombica]|uniref:Uncharacterized protein n=1 Tax=Atta colombica TaxID=520822 RepID=A0A151I166_9HYME|nr:hypothetical protein ALC53_09647 [Atta colombica]